MEAGSIWGHMEILPRPAKGPRLGNEFVFRSKPTPISKKVGQCDQGKWLTPGAQKEYENNNRISKLGKEKQGPGATTTRRSKKRRGRA